MIEFTGAVNLLIVYIGLFRLTLHWISFSYVIALFISMCMLSCNSCKFLSLQNFRRIGSEKISWISLPIRRMHQFFTMVVFKFCNALLCARTGRILLVFFLLFFFLTPNLNWWCYNFFDCIFDFFWFLCSVQKDF